MNRRWIACRVPGVITLLLMVAVAGAHPADAATSTSTATAVVIQPITILNVTPLNFGAVVSGGTSGTVAISSDGLRSVAGGALLGNAGAAGAAAFTVAGLPSATYSIALPASTTVSGGGNTMTVDTFTSNPSGTGALSVLGVQTLLVGATLHVGANQATGVYTGNYDVTVVYN
jgi:Domain of unknown function (DUF4402)